MQAQACQQLIHRQFRREFPEVIAVLHGDGGASAALGRNLSSTGIYFEFDEAIPIGSKVDLLIPANPHAVRCSGTVLRVNQISPVLYDIAVVFDEPHPVCLQATGPPCAPAA